jgi:ABC-type transport system involved in multi-copper enzyme maturation permease subunit
MIEFPLAALEFKRLTASRTALLLRLGPPIVCGTIVALFWLASANADNRAGDIANTTSAILFHLAVLGQAAVVVLFSPLFASTLLSRERELKTMELLLLADFRASSIYLAKFVAVFAVSQILIASALPLLAIASFLGGLSLDGIAANVAAFSALNLLVVTVSLMFSATAVRAMDAYVRAAIALLILFLLLGAADFAWGFTTFVTPGRTLILSMDRELDPATLLAGAAWAVVLAAPCAAGAIYLLQRAGKRHQAPPAATVRLQRRKRRELRRVRDHVQALYSAAATSASGNWMRFPRVLLLLAVAYAASASMPVFIVALPFFILYDATSSITGTVNSGALGELLLTGHPVDRLAQNIIRVHFHRTLFFGLLTVPVLAAPSTMLMIGLISENAENFSTPLLYTLVVAAVAATAAKVMFLCAIGCYEATYPGTPFARAFRALFYSWAASILVTMGCGYVLFILHLIGSTFGSATFRYAFLQFEVLLVLVLPAIVYYRLAKFWIDSFEFALLRRMGVY